MASGTHINVDSLRKADRHMFTLQSDGAFIQGQRLRTHCNMARHPCVCMYCNNVIHCSLKVISSSAHLALNSIKASRTSQVKVNKLCGKKNNNETSKLELKE